jgi:hypothetical protein
MTYDSMEAWNDNGKILVPEVIARKVRKETGRKVLKVLCH